MVQVAPPDGSGQYTPPRSPNHKYYSGSGSMKIVTICAISAAFAACSTSLLCIILLKDRTNNTISQLKQLEELNNKLDMPTQLEASVYQYNSLKDQLRERNHQDIVREAFVNLDQNIQSKENDFGPSKELDFAFIGWPKTGTSFLLKVLGDHPEVTMPESEFCDLTVAQDGGEKNLTRWMMTSQHKSLKSSVPQKYGIKCPHMIRKTQSIERLAMVYDSTRLVVGVRHPVLWFESFYNYRVKENYDLNLSKSEIIPAIYLNSQIHFKTCSVALVKYDLFLKQLAKVSLTMQDTLEMGKTSQDPFWEKRISPNPFKVFIYTPEQLSDANVTRQDEFRVELQEFLRLEAPLRDFNEMPMIKSNEVTYPEYIDICDPKYERIKQTLLKIGKKSSEWIIEKFIKSKDVVVSGEHFFVENLKTWGDGPCETRVADARPSKNRKKVLKAAAEQETLIDWGREVIVV